MRLKINLLFESRAEQQGGGGGGLEGWSPLP